MRTHVRADENRKWLTFAAVRLRHLLPNATPTDVGVRVKSSPAGLQVRGTRPLLAEPGR